MSAVRRARLAPRGRLAFIPACALAALPTPASRAPTRWALGRRARGDRGSEGALSWLLLPEVQMVWTGGLRAGQLLGAVRASGHGCLLGAGARYATRNPGPLGQGHQSVPRMAEEWQGSCPRGAEDRTTGDATPRDARQSRAGAFRSQRNRGAEARWRAETGLFSLEGGVPGVPDRQTNTRRRVRASASPLAEGDRRLWAIYSKRHAKAHAVRPGGGGVIRLGGRGGDGESSPHRGTDEGRDGAAGAPACSGG